MSRTATTTGRKSQKANAVNAGKGIEAINKLEKTKAGDKVKTRKPSVSKPVAVAASMVPCIFNEDLVFKNMNDAAEYFKVNRNTIYYWMSGRIRNRLSIAKRHGVITARKVADTHLIKENKKLIEEFQAKLKEINNKQKRDKSITVYFKDSLAGVKFASRAMACKYFDVSRQAMHQWEHVALPVGRGIEKIDWNRQEKGVNA